MALGTKLLNAWEHVLGRCGVGRGHSVVILIGAIANPDNVVAARLAAERIGARVLMMELGEPPLLAMAGDTSAYLGPTGLQGNRPAVEALKAAHIVVDLMGIDRGTEQQEILDAGARILLVKEPPDVLIRLLPNEEDKRRVTEAAQRLKRAKSLQVTSATGTNMTLALGEYPLLVQYGLADEAGRWDHWPGAFVATWPNEQSAEGMVVHSPGDAILPFKHYVREPISLTIEAGRIRRIEGSFDADYLREYMESFKDPEGYAVSHLGWGLQRRSSWTALGMYDKRQTNGMESRSFDGNFMFSTGPNAEAGGNRHTPCHLDIPMRNCSVFLDGEAVVESGRTVAT